MFSDMTVQRNAHDFVWGQSVAEPLGLTVTRRDQSAQLASPPFYVHSKLCENDTRRKNSGVMKLRRMFRVLIKTRPFSTNEI